MNAASKFGIAVAIAILIGAFVGWVNNIIDLFHATAFSGMVVLRAIGIFMAPLGAVLGYF